MSGPSVMRQAHFAVADALRAGAIGLVVLDHLITWMFFGNGTVEAVCGTLGYWGVDAFFVLSGFLLGRPYVDAVLGRRPFPDARLYARRRFLRIYPAYALVVVLSEAALVVHRGPQHGALLDVAAHLLLVHNLFGATIFGVDNGALWTMATDAQFYVLLPLGAFIVRLLRPAGERERARLIACALGIVAATALAVRLYDIVVVMPRAYVDVAIVQRGVLGMGFCFATGTALALRQAAGDTISKRRTPYLLVSGMLFCAMLASAL